VAGLATTLGSGAMTNSIADITAADVLLVTGSNTTEAHPVLALEMKAAVRKHGAQLILIDPRHIELAEFAALHLRHRPGSDVALFNAMAHVIIAEGLHDEAFIRERTENFEAMVEAVARYTPEHAETICEVPAGDIVRAARMYASATNAAIFWAMGITQHTSGTDNVKVLSNLALLTGNVGRPGTGLNPLRGQNNVQGACDMGGLPNVYPGYQPVADAAMQAKFAEAWDVPVSRLSAKPGLTVTEIMDGALHGTIRAIYVMGENPMLSDPDLNHVAEALREVDSLVVQDLFPNETAAFADVVLPASSFAEKSGTFTSTERRVHLVRPFLPLPGAARTDSDIIVNLANRMGAGWYYSSPSAVFDEMATVTPQYAGMTHQRLEAGGLQWPCPTPDHPGTPILHADRFTRGRGFFAPVDYRPPAEEPDGEYPLILSTGRILFHWHGGTMSRRSPGLEAIAPESLVEIHPSDAAVLGIAEGDMVRVGSRRGEVDARAHLTGRSPRGTIFMTFHYAEAATNLLTNNAVDPTAKIPEYKVSAVRLDRLEPDTAAEH
jgi:formate dehydrogenase major subunit